VFVKLSDGISDQSYKFLRKYKSEMGKHEPRTY
jgi:hypothetical protein